MIKVPPSPDVWFTELSVVVTNIGFEDSKEEHFANAARFFELLETCPNTFSAQQARKLAHDIGPYLVRELEKYG